MKVTTRQGRGSLNLERRASGGAVVERSPHEEVNSDKLEVWRTLRFGR